MKFTRIYKHKRIYTHNSLKRSLGSSGCETSTVRRTELVPPRLEELAHAVAGLPHRAVVLVERLAVVENLPHVRAKLLLGFVAGKIQ